VKVAVIGTGYVGLVTGACLADNGLHVHCVDTDRNKVDRLRNAEVPFFEPGLEELVGRLARTERLHFTTSLSEALLDAEVAFIAVGTPSGGDGAADLSQVLLVAAQIGELLARRISPHLVVVTKSTVPVGTAKRLREVLTETIAAASISTDVEPGTFDVASNPEFLKEGAAIADFAHPDRIVIGVDTERARETLDRVYRPFVLNGKPVLFMDVASAEITKYAANAMLATRISFMNAIAALCDATGADVHHVRNGIGSDARIGTPFLYAGAGYGGSCFPKDVRALASTARDHDIEFSLLDGVELVNNRQANVVIEKLVRLLGLSSASLLNGLTIAVWGIAFKPNTDDTRDAPSVAIIERLENAGARVRAYDPIAKLPPRFGTNVAECNDPYVAAENCDALVLVTEWAEFRNPDIGALAKSMRRPLILDARNVLDADTLSAHGFSVARVGRPFVSSQAGLSQ
jgi:UDPglucose 6-dehydrogenase